MPLSTTADEFNSILNLAFRMGAERIFRSRTYLMKQNLVLFQRETQPLPSAPALERLGLLRDDLSRR